MKKGVSVIIPAFNEQERLADTVKAIDKYMTQRRLNFEIIIVNDGSTDDTMKAIFELMTYVKSVWFISYKDNKGKGYAIRQGCIEARYETCILIDADHSVNINELDFFFNSSASYLMFQKPCIFGQRIQVVPQPIYRIALGKIFKIMTWFFTGIYADSQCPFKILNLDKSFYKELEIDGFAYDVEILYKLKLEEIPLYSIKVKYHNKEGSKVTFWKVIEMAKDIWRISWLNRHGKN